MKLSAALVALASLASAAPSGSPSPLDIKLEMSGNSVVKATITNTGKQNLKVFKPNSIFDSAPVEKVAISKGGKPLEFKGVRLRLNDQEPADDAFEHIAAGQSVEVNINVAETHDLSQGGAFDISTTDAVLKYATENDNKLVDAHSLPTTSITASVDGPAAASAHDSQKMRRTTFQYDCSGSRLQAVSNAANNCVSLARNAAQVARSGSASKMQEFFKSSSQQVRNTVYNVLTRVAAECPNNGGYSDTYCQDVGGYCGGNVLAYTVPSQSYIVYCDLYFNDLPPLTSACHQQDQATTNLHETTHLSQVAGTQDLGYGYNNIRQLSTQQSLNNADSYAVFANSIYAGC